MHLSQLMMTRMKRKDVKCHLMIVVWGKVEKNDHLHLLYNVRLSQIERIHFYVPLNPTENSKSLYLFVHARDSLRMQLGVEEVEVEVELGVQAE